MAKKVESIITIGSVPVISSFIFILGKGDLIKNELPDQFKHSSTTVNFYNHVAPYASANFTHGMNRDVNVEALLKIKPDIVFTMDPLVAANLQSKGINSIALQWQKAEDIKKIMLLLGDVLDAKKQAISYLDYFDEKLKYVSSVIKTIPKEEKKKVLYFDYRTMTTPHLIVDWWISNAGGIPLSDSNRKIEKYTFSIEQIILTNPDIIVLSNPNDIDDLYKNKKFSTLNAVKNRQIFATPRGIHLWAYRTSEQPLMLLWAAKTFYPALFKEIDMQKESSSFYTRFVGYKPNQEEFAEILHLYKKGG
ncbi:ABC transporter substrate-binding protein [Sulfurimonas sp.]|uniref:ABC transporter substrate-binding protein n=1 Tax=Sulfurimonas sp. TaxID=2022749 RepID=UPI002A3598B0|nr:ABC transporter substrate-binding protein [Sulfurimonas sp.]MDY0123366.1 ABC transporter substrate-binding protein [Sulfurimonas sp.]